MDKRMQGVALLALALAMTLVIYVLASESTVEQLVTYGYPGLALVMFISSATVILPAPGLAVVFAAGGFLNPILIGLFAGTGAALGEMTGYFAGYGGRQALDKNGKVHWIQEWMARNGFLTVFVFAAIPNPVFDVVGLVAGGLHYDVRKFLLAALMGNIVKVTYIAFAGEKVLGLFI